MVNGNLKSNQQALTHRQMAIQYQFIKMVLMLQEDGEMRELVQSLVLKQVQMVARELPINI